MTAIITPRNPREERLLYKSEVTSPVSAVEVDSSVDWTVFDYYHLQIRDLLMTTSNTSLWARLQNGSGYVSTAGAYKDMFTYGQAGGGYSDSLTAIRLDCGTGLSNTYPTNIDLFIYGMNDAAIQTIIHYYGQLAFYTGRYGGLTAAGARNLPTEANTGIQLLPSSSTIEAMKLSVFGGMF